jgi:photosystem II stability/assembly factor-like uncharacterized protein
MKVKILSFFLSALVFSGVVKAQEGWFTLFTEYAVTTIYTGMQFVNGNTGYLTSYWGDAHNNGGYTQKTTNGGLNWFSVESGVARRGVFFLNEQTGWTLGGYWDDAGKKSREVFRTTNGGVSFRRIYVDSLRQAFWRIRFADVNTGWIVTSAYILKTTNSGSNWFTCSNLSLYSFCFVNPNTGWGVTTNGIIYKTTNGGSNWINQHYVSGYGLVNITFINSNTGWACGNPPNIFKTTNSGSNWIAYGTEAIVQIASVRFADSLNGWFCTFAGEIFHSSNGGINWTKQYTVADFLLMILSFPNQLTGYVHGMYSTNPPNLNNIFLKTTTGGMVFVQNIGTEIPKRFSLSQNYPNPFNPVTKIKFSLPYPSKGGVMDVKLIIYDVLGREVATLVNDQLLPSTYEVEWDGSINPSEVYFYKLTSNDASTPLSITFTETKKMILLK